MTRQKQKPTIRQLEQRIERLEGAMGEAQQMLYALYHASSNDARRHEAMLEALCLKSGVDFVPPTNLEESDGGSEE
jgi:hypothetical protein